MFAIDTIDNSSLKNYNYYTEIYLKDPFLNKITIEEFTNKYNLDNLNMKYPKLYKNILSKIFELIAFMKNLNYNNENIKAKVNEVVNNRLYLKLKLLTDDLIQEKHNKEK